MAWKSSFRQNYRTKFSPTVPTSAAGISHVVADVEAPGGEKWEHLKSGGKQWQATPKNLPRMQRTRAIPVVWLNSGLCPDRPKGWIPIIISRKLHNFRGEKLLNLKCVFSLSLWHYTDICHCKNNWTTYYQKITPAFTQSIHYSWQILNWTRITSTVFEKSSNTKFH